MKYVLVSLTGDDATAANDEFARWFAAAHPPVAAFHGEHPDLDEVATHVRETRLALVFGHDGGGSLRGAAKGAAWVDPPTFSRIFAGARVWVYACETRSRSLDEDLESFGKIAFANGVRVFAGHASPVSATPPFTSLPALKRSAHSALARGFRAFLQGENNAAALRRAVLGGAAVGRGAVLGALRIDQDIESLRVLA